MSAAIETLSKGDLYDQFSKRMLQARAIADCLGNLNPEGGSLNDSSMDGAAWAVKDLLDQAREYAERIFSYDEAKPEG